ncbi:MAG: hypothetical protein HY052_02885, partial [Proteobacteria bacterium]|nr:hypothetical protein [Pseudomonadota bacterium]
MADPNRTNDQSSESGNGVHIVDPNNPQSLGLLTKAYRSIYKAAIPANAREPLEDWVDSLSGGNEVANMVVGILGESLDSANPILKGMAVGYYYKKQDAALLAYTLMDPQYSDQEELERAMLNITTAALQDVSANNGGKISGVFIEADDPKKISSGEDSEAAAERLRAFRDLGAKIVNIDYVAP